MQAFSGCVWMGGAFTEARQQAGGEAVSAPYAVRWCVAEQMFEPVNATSDAVGPIRVIEPALHTVHAPGCSAQGACTVMGQN
eukprot:1913537-Rhodomonas_salina.1